LADDLTIPDPSPVLEPLIAFRRSKVMFAAVKLGVFDSLASQAKDLNSLAGDLTCDADALERLLDTCVGMGLLKKHGPAYTNTPAADTYLSSDSPRRLTGYINWSNDAMWNLWEHLDDAVREGTHRWKQAYGSDGPIFDHFFKHENDKREFLLGMHGFGLIGSPAVVAAFDLSPYKRLVDLGGATGHLAVAACQRYPALHAVVFDLAAAVPMAQEYVASTQVADRIEIIAGDFFTDPLPRADLYALSRIVHDWSEPKILKLLTRVHDALSPGGAVLIAEKLLEDDKRGPQWAQLQNLNMLTCTEGKERTLVEYEQILTRVGFSNVKGCRTMSTNDAVLATKV
jgi:acetylserotonin O-methyltransferase